MGSSSLTLARLLSLRRESSVAHDYACASTSARPDPRLQMGAKHNAVKSHGFNDPPKSIDVGRDAIKCDCSS